MKHISSSYLIKIKAIEQYQKTLAVEGMVPDIEKLLLKKYRLHLQYAGALVLGLFVSMATLLISFIVFNKFLHVSF